LRDPTAEDADKLLELAYEILLAFLITPGFDKVTTAFG
jgi:hypothetical protein